MTLKGNKDPEYKAWLEEESRNMKERISELQAEINKRTEPLHEELLKLKLLSRQTDHELAQMRADEHEKEKLTEQRDRLKANLDELTAQNKKCVKEKAAAVERAASLQNELDAIRSQPQATPQTDALLHEELSHTKADVAAAQKQRYVVEKELSAVKRELVKVEEQLSLSEQVAAATLRRQLNEYDAKAFQELHNEEDRPAETSETRVRVRVRELYAELTGRLEAQSVAARMYQRNALTLKELQSIQALRDRPIEAAETLLNCVLDQPDAVYQCFLDALKHSDQHSVYEWIVNNSYTDYSAELAHTNIIQQHYVVLLENLYIYPLFVAELLSKGALSKEEEEAILAEKTSYRRNEKLLSVLSRKSAQQFDVFLSALDCTGQQHVNDHITGRQGPDEPVTPDDMKPNEVNPWQPRSVERADQAVQTSDGEEPVEDDATTSSGSSDEELDEALDAIRRLERQIESLQTLHTQKVRQHVCVFLAHAAVKGSLSKLLSRLVATNFIDQEEKVAIQDRTDAEAKVRVLATTVQQRTGEDLRNFINVLDACGEQHVAESARQLLFYMNVIETLSAADGADVCGLASIDDELYVLYARDVDQLDVYNITDYTFQRHLNVPGLSSSNSNTIASCVSNYSLYISDFVHECVHVVDLSDGAVSKLSDIADGSVGLSLTKTDNLLVTCRGDPNALLELSSDSGQCIRRIELQSDIEQPWHAVQLSSEQYVVCHGSSSYLQRLCVVGADGRITQSFGWGSDGGQMDWPRHVTVDKDAKFIFVADCDNDRVVQLSTMPLQFAGYVTERLPGKPWRLYLDDETQRLYVGLREGDITVIQLYSASKHDPSVSKWMTFGL